MDNRGHIDELSAAVGGVFSERFCLAIKAAIRALTDQDLARGADDGAATKDASRLLMSLGQHADPSEAKALIVRYLRSYYEAGYSCACAHQGRQDDANRRTAWMNGKGRDE